MNTEPGKTTKPSSAALLIADRIKEKRRRRWAIDHPPPVVFRDTLGIRVSPGLTEPCSVSHVLRNIAIVLYQKQGVDVRWEMTTRFNEDLGCQSFQATTEQFKRPHERPYLDLAWDIEMHHLLPSVPLQRGIIVVATSDHSRVYSSATLDELTHPAVRAVFALSPLCRETLINAGVPESSIHLLPLGVDNAIYRTDGTSYDGPDPAYLGDARPAKQHQRFICAGYMQKRKGIPEAVRAFCAAFQGRRDVCLVIKNVESRWGNLLRESFGDIEAIVRDCPQAPPVGYLGAVLSEWEMAAFLRGSHCLVSPHRREGFGLMPLQSMACGTPVLVTDYHGPAQYARADNCYLLPTTGISPREAQGPEDRVEWANYDTAVLTQLMQDAAANKDRTRIIQAGLAESHKWTWDRSAETVVDLIETNIGHVRHRPRKWYRTVDDGVSVSVVVPVRNASSHLSTLLHSLSGKLPKHAEVVVYDDASSDAERKAIERLCAEAPYRVRLLRGESQVGCTGARTILYEDAQNAFIASIDVDLDFSDTPSDWFEILTNQWTKRDYGIMHPLLVYPPGNRVESAGGTIGPVEDRVCQRRLNGALTTGKDLRAPRRVAFCSGAFQFFHATLLDEFMPDPAYVPAYYGDVDFCLRARVAGYPVWYCPEVRVTHDAGSWGRTGEGQTNANAEACRERFLSRWTDMIAEDLRCQDGTGALL